MPAANPSVLKNQSNDASFPDLWSELEWRGLVHVSTNVDELRALLAGDPITYYCGFDPTAPSLHLGNLVQLILMRRLQLAGHKPLGLVGDPPDLSATRSRPPSARSIRARSSPSGSATSSRR